MWFALTSKCFLISLQQARFVHLTSFVFGCYLEYGFILLTSIRGLVTLFMVLYFLSG